MPAVEIAKLRAEGLEKMIEWRLIEQVVRDAELYATDEEVDETIEAIASENGITVEQLRAERRRPGTVLRGVSRRRSSASSSAAR